MRKLIQICMIFVFGALVAAPSLSLAAPVSVSAAGDPTCEVRLLGIPPWYRGLSSRDSTGQCSIISPDQGEDGISNFIWKIVLNVIEIGLVLAGYLALFFILYGGFQFLTGGANSSMIEQARKTILNAVIGLAISMASIGIINLVFGVLG